MFVHRVAHLISAERALIEEQGTPTARYVVEGQLLFASSKDLTTTFEYADDPDRVVIDFTDAQVWDASTVAALDAIETKYRQHGTSVEFIGMNDYTSVRSLPASPESSAAVTSGVSVRYIYVCG